MSNSKNLAGLFETQFSLVFCMIGFVLFCIWLLWHIYHWTILPNPTPKGLRRQLVRVLSQLSVPEEAVICDCGSGLGLLVAHLQKSGFKNTFGAEGSRIVWALSNVILLIRRLPLSYSIHKPWQKVYLEADVLFFYISPRAMSEAVILLNSSNFSGIIITHTFALTGFKPQVVYWYEGMYRIPIYIYQLSKSKKIYTSCQEKGTI
jgi:hypothetical protein